MAEFFNNSDWCQNNKRVLFWRRAMFPAISSFLAFVCFALVYWIITVRAINPLYYFGLVFLLPALVLALIALLACLDKLNAEKTLLFTFITIPVSIIACLFLLFIIGMSQASTTVTSVSRYEHTMNIIKHSQKEQLSVFPEKIPNGAYNTMFYYNNSSWMEYSQTVVLQFSSNKETIKGYVERFKEFEIQENIEKVFDRVEGYYIKDLPEDYSVYVIIDEGSHDRKVCAVSISQERNDIIFYAYEMRW